MEKEINFDRFIRGLMLVSGVALGGVLLYWLSPVLIPFFVAWVAAYMLYPVVRFLQYRCRLRSRLLCIVIALLLAVGTLALFFFLVVPPMIDEFGHVKEVALRYIERGASNATIPHWLEHFLQRNATEHAVADILKSENLMATLRSTLPKVWTMLLSTAGIILNVAGSFIALLYILFILTDYERYAEGWIRFVPLRRRPFALQLAADVERYMSGYFRGQGLIALSNCVMFSIGFALIDFPLPVALGCFIGLISFVPYLQVVGIVPAALLALLRATDTGENFWWLILLVIVVYVVVQILQDTIFTPRIMGKIMGLPPAIILLSLSVWGYALGIIGLILALPVTTLAVIYYKRYAVSEAPASGANPCAAPSEKGPFPAAPAAAPTAEGPASTSPAAAGVSQAATDASAGATDAFHEATDVSTEASDTSRSASKAP